VSYGVTHSANARRIAIWGWDVEENRMDKGKEKLGKELAIFVKLQMCWYHVTFHLDLDFEHTLNVDSSGDHRLQVWWRSSHLSGRRSALRKKKFTDRRTTDAAPLH